jgi:hypothetical protein
MMNFYDDPDDLTDDMQRVVNPFVVEQCKKEMEKEIELHEEQTKILLEIDKIIMDPSQNEYRNKDGVIREALEKNDNFKILDKKLKLLNGKGFFDLLDNFSTPKNLPKDIPEELLNKRENPFKIRSSPTPAAAGGAGKYRSKKGGRGKSRSRSRSKTKTRTKSKSRSKSKSKRR